MNDVSVVNDVKLGLAGNLALVVKGRPIKGDVVSLPFAWSSGSIYEWLGPTIKSTALSVRIGDVIVGIKNLNFILTHEEYTAVATTLPIAFGHLGGANSTCRRQDPNSSLL